MSSQEQSIKQYFGILNGYDAGLTLLALILLVMLPASGCAPSEEPRSETTSPQQDKTAPQQQEFQVEFQDGRFAEGELINRKLDGYQGIWYKNTDLDNEYVYKYSGGLGTYTDYHDPLAVYSPEANKTFFTYGGTDRQNSTLFHMVSYYDHETGMVPRPTLVLDKHTNDAHDNPVIQMDEEGYIWLFSTSHGTSRPSYISRSTEPYSIDEFELIEPTKWEDGRRVAMDNFSYTQIWHLPGQGFLSFFTKYNFPANRTIMFMTSSDGKEWSQWKRLGAIEEGHYQISAAGEGVAGSALNYHPDRNEPPEVVRFPVNYRRNEGGAWAFERSGLDYRTNLYYLETRDFGENWQAADGTPLDLPLEEIKNPALVRDYFSEGLNVYPKDMLYDEAGHPVILYMISGGYVSGPENDPRIWKIARWDGSGWRIHEITTSDNNYDMGSLYLEEDGTWRLIAPTETGPQAYNTGGEMAMWISSDQGKNWTLARRLTEGSERNHSFARRAVRVHPAFYAFWADGHGRQPSKSLLYFADKQGNVYRLPEVMDGELARPERVR